MEFKVFSRSNAENYCKEPHNDKSIMISIKTPCDETRPDVNITIDNNIMAILQLAFDDVEEQYGDEKPISELQAKQIVEFVEDYKDSIDLIIVHCDAGISRSAGVCAALSKWLVNEDKRFFSGYVPNMKCYNTVLNTAMLK